jgi:hypothetical protein
VAIMAVTTADFGAVDTMAAVTATVLTDQEAAEAAKMRSTTVADRATMATDQELIHQVMVAGAEEAADQSITMEALTPDQTDVKVTLRTEAITSSNPMAEHQAAIVAAVAMVAVAADHQAAVAEAEVINNLKI